MTDPAGVAAESRELKWSIPANLRWLAEQHVFGSYLPCGMLPGEFLKQAAECIERLSRQSI